MTRLARVSRARVLLGALAVLCASGLVGATLAPAASAAPSSYVALGDSYSSGLGTRAYLADGTTCSRSVYAYASLIAAADGFDLNLRACAGATTADVANLQLDALSPQIAYVTIGIGGNDAGFTNVIETCALPSWLGSCGAAVAQARAVIGTQLPGRLVALYASIRAKAPNATVVAVGYPRIFNGTDCSLVTWFSGPEMVQLNDAADLLDGVVASAAATAGFGFADVRTPFTGHAVCDRRPWLNNATYPLNDSFHPNRAGQSAGFAPVVSTTLLGHTLSVTPAVLAAAQAAADGLAERQREYAFKDAQITPKSFGAVG